MSLRRPRTKPKAVSAATPSFDYEGFKIAPHADAITELITSNSVSAISAQTGSGKTLFIPHHLAQHGFKVRVAVPMTVAARSARDFQSKCSGLRIGFAGGREVQYTDYSQIVYGTTGHFTVKILSIIKRRGASRLRALDFQFLGDVFVVDEVHSGTTHITKLIGLLKYLKDHVADLKTHIVFTSATMNSINIKRYFPDFPVYEVELARLPITHRYSSHHIEPKLDDPTRDIVDIIRKELALMKSSPKGDMWHIIVFRPGANEVETLLQALYKAFDDEIEALPAYSDLAPEELQEIFENHGVPKVIVGTNIIESSVTIDNVGAIIDDGLVKRVFTNEMGGQMLTTGLVSCAEATQRAGRTARTRPGRAYHLYTEHYRDTVMTPHHEPEIDRVPIHNLVLSIIDAGLVPTEILGVSKSRQNQAVATLIRTNMLTPTEDGLGSVTEAGRFVSSVNLGIYNSCLIYQAIIEFRKKKDEFILISAVALAVMLEIYGPPPFYIPRKKRGQTHSDYQIERDVHIESYFERFFGATELHTLVNLYWTMADEVYLIEEYHRSQRHAPSNYLKEWAVKNSMNNKKLKEFRNTFRSVLESVASHCHHPSLLDDMEPPSPGELLSLGDKAMGFFIKAYSHNVFTQVDRDVYVDEHGNKYKHTRKTYCRRYEPPATIVAAQVIEIKETPESIPRRMIGLSIPIATD
jgi:HrpA-like RNA helicase